MAGRVFRQAENFLQGRVCRLSTTGRRALGCSDFDWGICAERDYFFRVALALLVGEGMVRGSGADGELEFWRTAARKGAVRLVGWVAICSGVPWAMI